MRRNLREKGESAMRMKWWALAAAAGILACGRVSIGLKAQDCAGLKNVAIDQTKVESAEVVPAGSTISMPMGMPGSQIGPLPAFCKVTGVIHDHVAADGKHYGIRFELRLPSDWNGKFFFQGGAGTDGNLSPAIGMTGFGKPTALERGYAVVSDDGGHQGGGDTSFGREQQARLDYAFESTIETTRVAHQLIAAYYGKLPAHSYFVGCSNGGREAMMAIERTPFDFDGAIAGDPGFRLTHAALGEAWDTQAFIAIAPKDAQGHPILSKAFSNADLKLVSDAVLAKCDALDGIKDGEINNFAACKFDPAVLACKGAKTDQCLSRDQIEALKKSFGGAHDSKGNALYSSWPYDAGIGDMGWRMWKIGTSGTAQPNAINTTMGAQSLTDYFVHPYIEGVSPWNLDFDHAAALTDQTARINDAVDTDLSTFAAHGGKLLIYEGLSDPVFSADDIVDYYRQLERDNGGQEKTASMARLFLIPGMTHCGGGPATDQFDSLTALEKWVEQGEAPQSIMASGAAFPGRTRPLCPYPQYAAYNGSGDPQDGKNFTCKNPE
jgi:feruloyl esterase